MYELKENQKMIYTFDGVNYQPTFNHFDVAKAYKYVLKVMPSFSADFYRHLGGNFFDDPIYFEKPHQLPLENISFKTALNIVCGVNPNINDTFMIDGSDSTQSIASVNFSDSQDLFDEYGKFCRFVYGKEDKLLSVFSNNKKSKINIEKFLKYALVNQLLIETKLIDKVKRYVSDKWKIIAFIASGVFLVNELYKIASKIIDFYIGISDFC